MVHPAPVDRAARQSPRDWYRPGAASKLWSSRHATGIEVRGGSRVGSDHIHAALKRVWGPRRRLRPLGVASRLDTSRVVNRREVAGVLIRTETQRCRWPTSRRWRLTNYRVIDESRHYLPDSSSAAAAAWCGRGAIPGPGATPDRHGWVGTGYPLYSETGRI